MIQRCLGALIAVIMVVSLPWVSNTFGQTAASCVKIASVQPSGEKTSLDPANVFGTESAMLVNANYNRLLDLDPNFQLKPELAQSWQPNADATVWTFKLRRGVKFHDAHELTADDVIFSLQRLIDPATGSEAAASLAFLKDATITAPDPYTVQFKLAKPLAVFPALITVKNTFIVEKGATSATLRLSGVGTGPFVPVDFAIDQQVHRLMKNGNYWERGLPRADCLEIYMIPDPTTVNAALQSGQIDVAEGVAFGTIRALQTDRQIRLIESPGPAYVMSLSMWVDTPPFNDARVRKALKMIIDRQQVVNIILLGKGIAGDDNPIPPGWPESPGQAPKPDVDGAKRLLAEAGYGPSKPLKIDLWAAEIRPGVVAMAQLYKDEAAQAGVDVNVIVVPAGDWQDKVWLKQPFITSTWAMRPAADALALAYRSSSSVNETHWKQADFDTLLDRAGVTVDARARENVLKMAAAMLVNDGGVIMPAFANIVAGERANCQGYAPHPQGFRFDFRQVSCTR
jgi:peptide/nickel transport system substrate-binding protein